MANESPDASVTDGGVRETSTSVAETSVDATNPVSCNSGQPSYPTATCGGPTPPGQSPMTGCHAGSCGQTASCAINESTCGSTSSCLPTATNTGPIWDLRIRRLDIGAPPALASTFVQNAVITHNIDLNAPQCGETGNGAFNWLLRFDSHESTLTTGGAPPAKDPFSAGFCFDRKTVPGFALSPQTTCTSTADGVVQSGTIDTLNVPIFLNADVNNVVLLPLHAVQFSRVRLSPDHACIGQLNPGALDTSCNEVDSTQCEKWRTDGAVAGYITLEEADQSEIADLDESLCVLLTQTSKGPDGKCVRDANGAIHNHGDYCSVTHAPGGCADSMWFGAAFAAAAVTINDGNGDPSCQ